MKQASKSANSKLLYHLAGLDLFMGVNTIFFKYLYIPLNSLKNHYPLETPEKFPG